MKNIKRSIGTKLVFVAAKLTEKTLSANANSTSCCIFYQPKAPAGLKKFRKIL